MGKHASSQVRQRASMEDDYKMRKTTKNLTGLTAALSLLVVPALALAGGAVIVAVENENLVITGDAGDNSIVISPTLDSSIFEISSGDGTTTINGSTATLTTLTTADRDFDIDLGTGNNTLELADGVNVTKSFKYFGSPNDDTLILGDVFVGRRSKLKLDDGANSFTCTACDLSQTLKILSGNDVLTVDIINSSFRGGINSGNADDVISVVDSGGGRDQLKIKTKDGNDTVIVDNVDFARKVFVNTGRNDDNVTIGSINANKKVAINGSTDNDTVTNNGGHGGVAPEITNFETFLP